MSSEVLKLVLLPKDVGKEVRQASSDCRLLYSDNVNTASLVVAPYSRLSTVDWSTSVLATMPSLSTLRLNVRRMPGIPVDLQKDIGGLTRLSTLTVTHFPGPLTGPLLSALSNLKQLKKLRLPLHEIEPEVFLIEQLVAALSQMRGLEELHAPTSAALIAASRGCLQSLRKLTAVCTVSWGLDAEDTENARAEEDGDGDVAAARLRQQLRRQELRGTISRLTGLQHLDVCYGRWPVEVDFAKAL
jgi:hypothetical protein